MTLLLSIFWGLLSVFGYSLSNVSSKPLAHTYGVSQILFLRGIIICVILTIIAIPSYHYFNHVFVVIAAVLLGMAGYLPVLAFTHGIKNSPLGIIAPIAGTSPLITVLLSFLFIHVHVSYIQWAAIVLIVLANISISFDLKNWKSSKIFQRGSGILYALIAAFGWGIFFFLLVPITNTLGPYVSALLVEVGVTIAAGIHIKLASQKIAIKDVLSPLVILNGALTCLGTIAFTVGVQYYNVGIVEVLSNSGAIPTTILGIIFFKERIHPKDRLATFFMIIGVIILSFA